MRRAAVYAALCLTTAACASLLGIYDVGYSPAAAGSEGGADGEATTDARSDSPGDGGTCDADLTRDPEHCGSCAHSCGTGGICSNSLCTPELVLSGIASASDIVRIAGATYVCGVDGVFRCKGASCGDAGEVLLRADVDEAVTSLAADEDAGMVVAILTILGAGNPDGRAFACPLGPCPSRRPLGLPGETLQTVALDDTKVLWAQNEIVGAKLLSCAGGQCDGSAEVIGTSLASTGAVTAISPRSTSILWMAGSRIIETKRDGGTAVLATIGASSHQPLLNDGNRVLFGNSEARLIEQSDVATCAASRTVYSSVGGDPRALARDGAFVYMAVDAPGPDAGKAGFVGRALRTDGAKIEKLAQTSTGLKALTVDDTHVYWADADGFVWRVMK
jgi:hypothetical protein